MATQSSSPARIIASDAIGMMRVCGLPTTVRWLWKIATNLSACRTTGTLHPADLAMGDKPIGARLRGARATLVGHRAISGIREIWIRDLYLGGGFLEIRDGDTVLDLGCNMGNFTLLALGHGPAVRVVAVEPNKAMCEKWRKSVAHNNWTSRAVLVNAFVGADTAFQEQLLQAPDSDGVEHLDESQLIAENDLERIDFLKCDIEGSEYSLLRPGSKLLSKAKQIAIEVHADCGDPAAFRQMLEDEGFEVRIARAHPDADILLARRR